MSVSYTVHSETDYYFHTQEDASQMFNLISYDTITNGKQKLIIRHVFNQNEERLVILANTPTKKMTAVERCAVEVTTVTENATTIPFQFDNVIDKDELSKL